jgi:hypothetical protein
MKRLALLLALAAPVAAFADGIDNMVAQCEEVMRCQLCQVTNAPSPKGATTVISYRDKFGKARAEVVDAGRYGWFQEPGYAKDATGHYLMCQRVRVAMENPESVEAKLPRIMFRQDWHIGDTYCPRK